MEEDRDGNYPLEICKRCGSGENGGDCGGRYRVNEKRVGGQT